MLSPENWLSFEQSEKLEKNGENDPEENPFKSRYEAREILENLRQKLSNFLDQGGTDCPEVVGSLAGIYLKMGRNFVQTEERKAGDEHCLQGLEILGVSQNQENPLSEPSALLPETVNAYLGLLNYLGFIAESWGQHETAKKRLGDAETVYAAYKVQQEDTPPLTLEDCMKRVCGVHDGAINVDDFWKSFENLHTHTVYFLAQVYKNTEELSLSANYCEKTLVRQLESGEYDSIDWALNAATLSQYYIDKSDSRQTENFNLARHCLAAAEAVIKSYETTRTPKSKESYDQLNVDEKCATKDEDEKFHTCKADVYRCWCKYGIALLDASFEGLKNADSEKSLAIEDIKLDENEPSLDPSLAEIEPLFPQLELQKYEDQVTAKLVTSFEDARDLFLIIQRWISVSREYYTLEEWASDAVQLIQDHSRLYKALANFEPQVDRKSKMHKRRVDMLTNVLEELNQSFFLSLCRQLIFEIGETYNEMLNLKLDALDEAQITPNEHQIQKINMLASQGIKFFQRFINTFKREEELPEKFADATRPIVLCHFYIARLWNKQLTSDLRQKYVNLAQSLEHYRWIVTYCEKTDPECIPQVKEEYEACSDMANLLPIKMDRIKDLIH